MPAFYRELNNWLDARFPSASGVIKTAIRRVYTPRPMITRCLLLFAALLSMAFATENPTGVEVSLLSEQRAIAAGKPFTVALKIHHHPQYHTYWRHPGIVGVPTNIKWQLPEGFTAGNIQWPYPQRVMMKQYPAIGYERDVMLLVEITPPSDLASDSITLRATATWMACAEGCYPGEKQLELTLPVAKEPQPDVDLTAAFNAARGEIPQPLEHWRATASIQPPEEAGKGGKITIQLSPADTQVHNPGKLQIFSSDGQMSSELPIQSDKQADGSITITAPRAEYSPKGIATLPCVLVAEKPFWPGGPRWVTIEPSP